MPSKTYIEFGSIINTKKVIYNKKIGNMYDTYMMSRYFKDLHALDTFQNKNDLKVLYKSIHHKKDLKINFVNFLLVCSSKSKKFYEFGQTLFEKIYFLKVFSIIFKKKINLYKINWAGNDISKMFNFFCNNFYKSYRLKVFSKPNYNLISNATFFSKGITLLYEKQNLSLLKYVFKNAKCGSFDFTICKSKKVKKITTGYKLFYPSIKAFLNIIPKDKSFFFKNIKKKKGGDIYFEIVFGEKKIIKNYFKMLTNIQKNNQNKFFLKRICNLNANYKDLNFFIKKINKAF